MDDNSDIFVSDLQAPPYFEGRIHITSGSAEDECDIRAILCLLHKIYDIKATFIF